MSNESAFLNMMLNDDCSKCGSARVEVSFDQLPDDMKDDHSTEDGDMSYHLYCPTCNEYSTVMGGSNFDVFEMFDNDSQKSPLKLNSSPSLNAPCPCGSTKKYKRCCGQKAK